MRHLLIDRKKYSKAEDKSDLVLIVVVLVIPGRTGQRVVGRLRRHRGQLGPQLRRLHRRRRRKVDRRGAHPARLAAADAAVPHRVSHLHEFLNFNRAAKSLL